MPDIALKFGIGYIIAVQLCVESPDPVLEQSGRSHTQAFT